jgi:hypothetical protein
VNPKLRSLLARVVLVGGIAFVASYVTRSAPHDQTIAIRFTGRSVRHVDGVVTKVGDSEPTAGFTQNFSERTPAPSTVRHRFSAANGTYIVVIRFTEAPATATEALATDASPKLSETTLERRVSLVGGEVIVSPD